jgi:hypothetical protein
MLEVKAYILKQSDGFGCKDPRALLAPGPLATRRRGQGYRLVLQGDGRKLWLNAECRLRADSRYTTWRHGMDARA